jgi:hypothetical protein
LGLPVLFPERWQNTDNTVALAIQNFQRISKITLKTSIEIVSSLNAKKETSDSIAISEEERQLISINL